MHSASTCRHEGAVLTKRPEPVPSLTKARLVLDARTKVRNTYQRERRRRVETIVEALQEGTDPEKIGTNPENDSHGTVNYLGRDGRLSANFDLRSF